jgi:hypothetical protein
LETALGHPELDFKFTPPGGVPCLRAVRHKLALPLGRGPSACPCPKSPCPPAPDSRPPTATRQCLRSPGGTER